MPESKHMLKLREKYAFTPQLSEDNDGKWIGQVVRFPHPLQQPTAWGLSCGTICRGDSEDDLKKQLMRIVDEYDN